MPRPSKLRVLLLSLPLALASCGGGSDASTSSASAAADAPAEDEAVTVRLGMFPNVTHAPGLVGVHEGIFEAHLGENDLDVAFFNAGPEAIESLFADALDIAYIGPNPAINAFNESDGTAVRIIAGAASGGAYLVVSPDIETAEDLRGTTLSTPQLGGTQDVALRSWLQENGLESDTSGGGDVSIAPQANADTLAAFQAGDIAGAWVPEPWATRLVREGGGTVLVDERDLWPDGEYVTTHVIVRTEFLEDHPDVVEAFLEGHVEAVELATSDAETAKAAVNAKIDEATGKPIAGEVLDAAWDHLTFTVDPIASSLERSKDAAVAVGLLDEVDLEGIYDLTILNGLLDEDVEGL